MGPVVAHVESPTRRSTRNEATRSSRHPPHSTSRVEELLAFRRALAPCRKATKVAAGSEIMHGRPFSACLLEGGAIFAECRASAVEFAGGSPIMRLPCSNPSDTPLFPFQSLVYLTPKSTTELGSPKITDGDLLVGDTEKDRYGCCCLSHEIDGGSPTGMCHVRSVTAAT